MLNRFGSWPLVLVAIVAILAGGATLVESVPQYDEGRAQLGAGAYPTWVGLALIVLGAIMLYRARLEPVADEEIQPRSNAIVVTLALLATYLVLLPRLGFTLSTAGFLLVHMALVGRYSIARAVGYTIVLAIAIGLVFVRALPIGLPTGVFGF